MTAELVLGSVQLGQPYGVANRSGQPSHAAALSLVARAVEHGVTWFDTARAYGDSEARLGEALAGHPELRVVTKLSPLSDLPEAAPRAAVRAAVDASIEASLTALRRNRLDCLMLHRACHRTSHGGAIWERLIEWLEDGTLLSLGVSVQSPDEALEAVACKDVQHLQMPFNLLDGRWQRAGVIAAMRARAGLTVHVRSVYLQGLLAANDASLWPQIGEVEVPALVALIAALTRQFDRHSAADLCLAYVRGQDWLDGVVVGMETEAQLQSNLALFARPPLAPADCAAIARRIPLLPAALLDPAQWPKS